MESCATRRRDITRIVEDAARKLGIATRSVELRTRDDLERAFAAMVQWRADGLVVLPEPVTFGSRAQVVALAAKHRLPGVYWQREYADAGGLMSYGSNLAYQFRRAAFYVDKILKGARPGELAVEQAAKFDLVINLKTARQLGLALPPSLRLRADEIIE